MEILNDYTPSIIRAFGEIAPLWRNYEGLVIGGTHHPHDTEIMIEKIKEARETGRPFYGECFAYQLAAIEFARNVLKIKDAASEELNQCGTFVVKKRKDGLNVGIKKVDDRYESFWNNYEVIPEIVAKWEIPKNFFIAQYHASYQSAIDKPHPLIVKFLKLCKKQNVE